MSRQSAHDWSDTQPTTILDTVLEMPIIEMRRAPSFMENWRSCAKAGRKLNGMKKPEKKKILITFDIQIVIVKDT